MNLCGESFCPTPTCSVRHWSQVPLLTIGAISSVAAVGLGALSYVRQDPFLMPASILLCINGATNGLGSVCIGRFKPEFTLSQNVDRLEQEKNRLGEKVGELEEQNNLFKEQLDALQEERETLEAKTKELRDKYRGIKKQLRGALKTIRTSTTEIKEMDKAFSLLEKISKNVVDEVAKFNEENRQLDQLVSDLGLKVKLFHQEGDLDEAIRSFERVNHSFLARLKEFCSLQKRLKEEIGHLAAHHEALKMEKEHFAKVVSDFDLIEDRVRKSVEEMSNLPERLERVPSAYLELLRKLDNLKEIRPKEIHDLLRSEMIERLSKIETIEELKAFVSSLSPSSE